jgi:hypothetical protein
MAMELMPHLVLCLKMATGFECDPDSMSSSWAIWSKFFHWACISGFLYQIEEGAKWFIVYAILHPIA